MSDTSDRALDLADQWAKAIGQKLSDAAPGAYDVAVEAVKVKIGSEILSWMLLAICLCIIAKVCSFCWGNVVAIGHDAERSRNDEETPYVIGGIISTVAGVFLLVGVMATFPSKEIIGIFAPKGYVALMLFDAAKSKR